MLGLSSWSELAPDKEALRGDPAYTFCCWLACGLFLLCFYPRPGALEVVVRLEEPVMPSTVVHGTVVLGGGGSEPGSRSREIASCRPVAGSCRLSFRWRRGARPLFQHNSALTVVLNDGGAPVALGAVAIVAPTWFGRSQVSCGLSRGCSPS